MVSLLDTCSLDISFDAENNKIIYGEGVKPAATSKIILRQLIPTLLNKSLSYPEEVYEEHNRVRSECDQEMLGKTEISFDVICLPAGLLGVEYIKTHIYYTPDNPEHKKFSTIIEVHYGILTVIMQKNAPKEEFDFETHVNEGLLVKVRKGQKFVVPQGYLYTFINTEDEPVLFVRIYKRNSILDYTLLKRERGLAYYCIRKNARQEIVLNPLYRNSPRIKEIPPEKFWHDFEMDWKIALYELLKQRMMVLEEVLWS